MALLSVKLLSEIGYMSATFTLDVSLESQKYLAKITQGDQNRSKNNKFGNKETVHTFFAPMNRGLVYDLIQEDRECGKLLATHLACNSFKKLTDTKEEL